MMETMLLSTKILNQYYKPFNYFKEKSTIKEQLRNLNKMKSVKENKKLQNQK